MIRSSILLAAGRGKRQRPYTDRIPKPLLPVRGRPTLDYILTSVKRAGLERICFVTNHLEDQIFAYVGDGSRWNLNATFAHQNELRGNGDALLSVPRDWILDGPVMVVATDYILEEKSLLELVEAHDSRGADITVSLKVCPPEELSARSSVEVDAGWRVKKIIEKPTVEEILSPYAASIMFIFPPAIWEYLPKVEPSPRGGRSSAIVVTAHSFRRGVVKRCDLFDGPHKLCALFQQWRTEIYVVEELELLITGAAVGHYVVDAELRRVLEAVGPDVG